MKSESARVFIGALFCVALLAGPAHAAAPVSMADTNWTLYGTARASIQRAGSMCTRGFLYVSFYGDGTFYMEDEDGYGFGGNYGYDARGKLWVQIDETTVEQFVYSNLTSFVPADVLASINFGIAVQSAVTKARASSGRRGTSLNLSLAFKAVVVLQDPETGEMLALKMNYRASAKGAQSLP